VLYFILSLITSTLGSLIGIGGGVILRPSLKLIGESAKSAAALSTFTVFIMAVISVYKYNKSKKIDYRTGIKAGLLIVPGSYAGTFAITYVPESFINFTYLFVLFILICMMFFKEKIHKIEINSFFKLIISLVIGFCAGILGIGGGPFLIPLLMFVFHTDIKNIPGTSVFIVFISSIFSLAQHMAGNNIDYSRALPLAAAAIAGSIIGTRLNRKINEKTIINLYNIIMIVLFLGSLITLAV
jgi:uncharacterized membrane protein YfcA